jgi:hypothetical protein
LGPQGVRQGWGACVCAWQTPNSNCHAAAHTQPPFALPTCPLPPSPRRAATWCARPSRARRSWTR